MISSGKASISKSELLSKISEGEIANHYLGITKIPCVINSPLRVDNHPSLGLYSIDGKKIYFKDYATGDSGDLFNLLEMYFNLSFDNILQKIDTELVSNIKIPIKSNTNKPKITYTNKTESTLEVTVREWRDYDLEYWGQFGITLNWLQWADVYPISHKIITAKGKRMVFGTDKLAYAYIEHKEGNTTIKVYQPLNKQGFKWQSKHDSSVISLWTKIPEKGNIVVICASLKDALCLSANTLIPALAIQGEGYGISETAINELKRRYKYRYILLDNDKTGLMDAEKLQQRTGFTNIILPGIKGNNLISQPKDIAEYYQVLGKKEFIQLINNLFKLTNHGT